MPWVLCSSISYALVSVAKVCCCICAGQSFRKHSPGGSTFLREMTLRPPSLKCDGKSKIRLRQSMPICVKNILSYQISSWSDFKRWSLRLFYRRSPDKNNNKMSSDMGSVPDSKKLKLKYHCHVRISLPWSSTTLPPGGQDTKYLISAQSVTVVLHACLVKGGGKWNCADYTGD